MWGELSGVGSVYYALEVGAQRSVMSAVVRAVGRLSEVLLGGGSEQSRRRRIHAGLEGKLRLLHTALRAEAALPG